jgi:hypothetical protein
MKSCHVKQMLDASIIICTHNPRMEYLRRVIKALRGQSIAPNRWELIIVDNSSMPAVDVSEELSWHSHAKVVVESRLGLAFARQAGIAASSAQLLIFVDDDNVLAHDYISRALEIAENSRFLGAWGSGSVSLEFEVEPSDHLTPLLAWLGLREAQKPSWANVISCSDATPIGAGLCVRRTIAESYARFLDSSMVKIAGRKGRELGAHEDYEICYLACVEKLGMGVFPDLRIRHLISKERTTDAHMLRLVESVSLSHHILIHKWSGNVPKPPFSVTGVANIVRNLIKRRGFDRKVYLAELRALIAARKRLTSTGASPGESDAASR